MSSGLTHTVRFTIDANVTQFVIVEIECPFDPADASRPCWTHDDNGERLSQAEGEAFGCVYKSWVEAEGIDCFHGDPIVIERALTEALWVTNDHFEFAVGEIPTGPR